MATVEVYEMAGASGPDPIQKHPILAKHVLTIGSTSGADLTSTFNRSTNRITAMSTAAFRFAIGSAPTSTSLHAYWPGEVPLDCEVVAGHKFLALASTTT